MANGRVYEQIPHPRVRYAYLAIEADTWNQFEALRSEALKKHPMYRESAFEESLVASAAAAAGVEVEQTQAAPEVAPVEEAAPAESAPAAGPTSTEGLSPREIAKLRMQQKKEATNG